MTPKPLSLGLLVCDYLIVEKGTGKISPIGCFTGLPVGGFPSLAHHFSVFTILTGGHGKGLLQLVVTRLDTDEEIYTQEQQADFPDRLRQVNLHYRVRMCSFPEAGWYQFTLLADGEYITHQRIRVYAEASR